MASRCDVVVVGGGPAGAAAAIGLARAGRSVVILERSGYEQSRIGETLPPAAQVPLARLQLWDLFVRQGHLPSPATISAWGKTDLDEHHFVVNPYGHGWHLDRRRFDEMLSSAAVDCGARLERQARMSACMPCARGVRVEYARDGAMHAREARFVVDATGRTATVARCQGAKRIAFDGLTAVVGIFSESDSSPAEDSRTLVEAVADGWWYSARLPQSRKIVVFMTDADLLPRPASLIKPFWQHQLSNTRHTRARVGRLDLPAVVRAVPARCEALDQIVGRRWLATGDAALSFDPLSSQGICHALQSGVVAAHAIDECLAGRWSALADVPAWVGASFENHWRLHQLHYAREQRWPNAPFWRRRQTGTMLRARGASSS
jgi:flavin-dependent dehydrogenase